MIHGAPGKMSKMRPISFILVRHYWILSPLRRGSPGKCSTFPTLVTLLIIRILFDDFGYLGHLYFHSVHILIFFWTLGYWTVKMECSNKNCVQKIIFISVFPPKRILKAHETKKNLILKIKIINPHKTFLLCFHFKCDAFKILKKCMYMCCINIWEYGNGFEDWRRSR